jgi:hypothetical protein
MTYFTRLKSAQEGPVERLAIDEKANDTGKKVRLVILREVMACQLRRSAAVTLAIRP